MVLGLGDARIDIKTFMDDKAARAMDVLKNKSVTLGGKLMTLGSRVRSAGQSMTIGLTVPIIALGTAIVRAFVGFDDEMAKISALSSASTDDVARWRDEILQLAPEVAKSPQELAEALFFLASAGLEVGTEMDVLEIAAMASATGLGETKDVALALSAILFAYGDEAITAAEATGILIKSVEKGNLETDEMAGVLGRVLGVASELGIPFNDVAATLASMSLSGLDASETVTGLKGIMRALINPSAQAEKALEGYGLSADKVRESVREKGLLSTLAMLIDVTGGNSSALADLFPRMEGFVAVTSLMGASADETLGIFSDLADTTGDELAVAFEKVQTDGFEMRQAMAQLQVVLIQLGETVVPILVTILGGLVSIIGRAIEIWDSLPAPVQRAIVIFVILVAALGPLLIIVGAIIAAIGALMLIFGLSVGAAALITGGVFLLIAAIALLVTGIILAIQHWDDITAAMGVVIDKVQDVLAWFEELPVIGAIVSTIRGIIEDEIADIVSYFQSIIAIGQDVISFFANVFTGDWDAAWGDIKDIAQGVLTLFLDWLQLGFMDEILSRLTGWIPGLASKTTEVFQSLFDAAVEKLDEFLGWLTGLPGRVFDAIGDVASTLFAKGIDLLQGLWNGLKDLWRREVRGWLNIASKVKAAVGNVAQTLTQKGKDLMRGLWDGLKDFWARQVRGWLNIAGKVRAAVGNVTSSLNNKGRNLIGGLWDGMKSMWSSVASWLRDLPNKARDAFASIGTAIRDGIRSGINEALRWLHNNVRITIPGFDPPGPGSIPGFSWGFPFMQFAKGGIVRRPTLALLGEEGPEAVIPLDDAGAAGFGNVTINVTVEDRSPAAIAHAVEMAGIRLGQQLSTEGV